VFDFDLIKIGAPSSSDSEPDAGNLRFYQMDVIVDKQTATPPVESEAKNDQLEEDCTEIVTPLFKLVPGRATKSYGIACARMAGVPEAILVRAGTVTRALEARERVPQPRHAGAADVGYSRISRCMDIQAACADCIMSVEDWENSAQPGDLRKVLKCLASAASLSSDIDH
jgi:DNA mismatch repair ATPase MutS